MSDQKGNRREVAGEVAAALEQAAQIAEAEAERARLQPGVGWSGAPGRIAAAIRKLKDQAQRAKPARVARVDPLPDPPSLPEPDTSSSSFDTVLGELSGVFDHSGGYTGGAVRAALAATEPNPARCRNCDGRGEVYLGAVMPVADIPQWDTCSRCKGSGKAQEGGT